MSTIYARCRAALRNAKLPKYRALTEAIAVAISDGSLVPGAQLPPQRELAAAVRVTLGTITRAYSELEKRGLVVGDVGRGTFVRQQSEGTRGPFPSYDDRGIVHLDANHPAQEFANAFEKHLFGALRAADTDALWSYADRCGSLEHRTAGAEWLGRLGLTIDPERVVITCGAQHGIFLAIATVARPGQNVAVEELTFPGVIAAARLLGIDLSAVPIDEHGIVPPAFEEVCRKRAPKALYCVPTLQNPTASVLPAARRSDIAEIARRYGVAIIEDDVYAPLVEAPPPPLSSFCPEMSFYLSSLSKTVCPGLRVGYLHVPAHELTVVRSLSMTTTLSPSPLTAEVAAHAIRSGWADETVSAQRASLRERWQTADRVLGRYLDPAQSRMAPHAWLSLPKPWRAREFERACRQRGVAVAPAELFAAARTPAPQAVRLSLSAPMLSELRSAVEVVATTLESEPTPTVLAI